MCGGLGSGAVRVGEVVFCLCTWENVRGGMRIEKGKWRTCPRDRSGFCQRCVCQFVCLFVFFFFFSGSFFRYRGCFAYPPGTS